MRLRVEEIVTDNQIDLQFLGTNYGDSKPRDVIKFALLKSACGYVSGLTTNRILQNLELFSATFNLTKKGKEYLFAAFGKDYK